MNTITCACPGCGKTLGVNPQMLGHTLRCPGCKQPFRAPSAGETPYPAASTPRGEGGQRATPRPQTHPQQIGRFQVRARLGAGAFGTVYRAYDPQLDREVALKVPLPGILDEPAHRERFLREARAAAQLQHPHIVPLFDAGTDPTFYLASAFIEGETLAASLAEGGLDFRTAASIVQDLAEALAYAHEKGVIHRDVKPANVMLDGQGRPHLMDFGLAHRCKGEEKLTQAGDLLGTPAYMAPELVTEPERGAQPTADQYALGVVLYELLTGKTPFDGPAQVVLFQAIHAEVPLPSRVKPALSGDLETICLKAMARRPEDRYATCQEMADVLQQFLTDEPIRARRLGRGEQAVRWMRRHPVVAGLITLAAIVLVAGTTISTAGHQKPPFPPAAASPGKPGKEEKTPPGELRPTDGFVSLFDGKSLTSWRKPDSSTIDWIIVDGTLVGKNRGGPGAVVRSSVNEETTPTFT